MSADSATVFEVVADTVWGIAVPFANGVVHVYVVRGSRVALVDSGVARVSEPRVLAALEQLGIAPSDVDVVVDTHGHPDHAGGNADLRAALGPLSVVAHPADAWLMRGPDAHLRHECDPASTLAALGDSGTYAERRRFLHDAVAPDTGVDRSVSDGDTVDLGGLTLRVVHTPGHTEGSVCLSVPELGVLFTGDAVERCGGDAGLPPMYVDPAAYRSSLERLRSLAPDVVCLSHAYVDPSGAGEPVLRGSAVGVALQESLDTLDRLGNAVAAAAGEDLRRATTRVCSALGLDPGTEERFARAAVTVRAHLR